MPCFSSGYPPSPPDRFPERSAASFPVPRPTQYGTGFPFRHPGRFFPDSQREPPVFPDETGRFFDFVNVITENLISKLRVPVQQKDESDSPVPEVLNMFMRDMPPVSKNRNADIIIPRDFSASLLPRVRLF